MNAYPFKEKTNISPHKLLFLSIPNYGKAAKNSTTYNSDTCQLAKHNT